MRCAQCRSYIPEGLPSPVTCPLCGKRADGPVEPSLSASRSTPSFVNPDAATAEPVLAKTESRTAENAGSARAFAPYFTIQTALCFGVPGHESAPADGSISFGQDGFSLVWDDGRQWEKITYRDLAQAQLKGDAVTLSVRDIESRLIFPHSWLPKALSSGARKRRALLFLELLGKVREGLSPFEVKMYQRRFS